MSIPRGTPSGPDGATDRPARVDRAARLIGLDLLPAGTTRVAVFGPGPGTPGFILVVAPAGDRALGVHLRPSVGYRPASRGLVEDLVRAWSAGRPGPEIRLDEREGVLLVEAVVRIDAVDALDDEELADQLIGAAQAARDLWDRLPLEVPDPPDLGDEVERWLAAGGSDRGGP